MFFHHPALCPHGPTAKPRRDQGSPLPWASLPCTVAPNGSRSLPPPDGMKLDRQWSPPRISTSRHNFAHRQHHDVVTPELAHEHAAKSRLSGLRSFKKGQHPCFCRESTASVVLLVSSVATRGSIRRPQRPCDPECTNRVAGSSALHVDGTSHELSTRDGFTGPTCRQCL